MLKAASVSVLGSTLLAAKSVAQESTDRLEIVAPRGESVSYSFTSDASVERVAGNSFAAAESDQDSITQGDSTWTVEGTVEAGYADAFRLSGPVRTFEPTEGNYRLYLNGDQVAREDIVEPKETRTHSYSFEATGDSWADYYLEVEDGGKMIASTVDGATIDPEFHWVSDDGTKAAGRVHPGDRHAYEFDTLVQDVTIEGEADAFVNGRQSNLDRYPLDGATGDGWKSGFPWQQQAEQDVEREHSYSFEATGDSWADYYLEVEDGGRMVASTVDGATIDPEFHWVSDDGTKAAGRVHPGDRHAYEFDTLVQDVTIEGEADAFVNGSPSSLYLYPQPGATGDGWKSGFPWQDEEQQQDDQNTGGIGIRHGEYQGSLGGGDGMESSQVYSASEADTVVSSMNELQRAVDWASSGDVIYVQGSISGYLDARTPGITIAGNRGIGSDGRWTNASMEQNAANVRLDGLSIDAGRGSFCAVNDTGLEVFNCLVENASDGDGAFGWNTGDTGALFSHCTFRDFGYYGIQVRYNWHSESDKITIQYCDFNDLGQHMVQGGYGWFHLKDNHFRGTLNHSTDHVLEVRGQGGSPVPCGANAGNAIVEHNLHEAHGSSGAKSGLVRVRGVPTDGVWVRNNKSLGNSDSTGGCHESGSHGGWSDQLVMQNASGGDGFSNVTIENNET